MRIPFASYGRKTMLSAAGIFVALAAGGWFVSPWLGIALLAPAGFVLYFFRDPERRAESEAAGAVLAPADGKVMGVFEADMPVIGGKAVVVDIFLSVFDVHVNRMPVSGGIIETIHKPGLFLNAMRREAGDRNENNTILIERDGGGKIAVKQIAGVIARRIVCGVRAGERVSRGGRIGMIKFGSRTQLFVPAEMGFRPAVSPGARVRGGQTVVGHLG